MSQRFSETVVAQALISLSAQQQLAFALSCSERLYPNYLAFKRETGWGNPSALRKALDIAWASLDRAAPSATTIAIAREQVLAAEPETEDFDTVLVSAALDAAVSADLILRFLEEGKPERVVEIASLCRDTVDMFVQDYECLAPTDPNLEDRILYHRLMQAELQRQHDDLLELRCFSGASPELDQLRAKWRYVEMSNIEKSLIG